MCAFRVSTPPELHRCNLDGARRALPLKFLIISQKSRSSFTDFYHDLENCLNFKSHRTHFNKPAKHNTLYRNKTKVQKSNDLRLNGIIIYGNRVRIVV